MKLLITGGAGFIGSNLCEYFVGNGYDVVCFDNLSTGFRRNIEPLLLLLLRKISAIWKTLWKVVMSFCKKQRWVRYFVPLPIPSTQMPTIKWFVYAASSSTYGNSKELSKIEHTIGLRYFNVFGRRQDPNGAYAVVISLWVKVWQLLSRLYLHWQCQWLRKKMS